MGRGVEDTGGEGYSVIELGSGVYRWEGARLVREKKARALGPGLGGSGEKWLVVYRTGSFSSSLLRRPGRRR